MTKNFSGTFQILKPHGISNYATLHVYASVCVHSTALKVGQKNAIIHDSFKLPNRKSDSYHPAKRRC